MFAMIISALNTMARIFADARQLQLAMHKRYPGLPE
jgi:hypothetical protein